MSQSHYNILVLDYNRPKESELCLESIEKFAKFNYKVIYLSNGGEQDYAIDFYKRGLIDKLILRKSNSGCGLGTRELFNDFDLDSDFVFYVQCDQFMVRDLSQEEIDFYISKIKDNVAYVDLAGNQGRGIYSERAHFISKSFYNKIPNTIGGPGPYANQKWTEQSLQEYLKENGLKFATINPLVFADNGKCSLREYPCGGQLLMYADTKQVFVLKPITKRVDFINIHLTDSEWEAILSNKWQNGTIPEQHRDYSFKVWEKPYDKEIL
jgi:hypothetical protein